MLEMVRAHQYTLFLSRSLESDSNLGNNFFSTASSSSLESFREQNDDTAQLNRRQIAQRARRLRERERRLFSQNLTNSDSASDVAPRHAEPPLPLTRAQISQRLRRQREREQRRHSAQRLSLPSSYPDVAPQLARITSNRSLLPVPTTAAATTFLPTPPSTAQHAVPPTTAHLEMFNNTTNATRGPVPAGIDITFQSHARGTCVGSNLTIHTLTKQSVPVL